MSRPWERAIDVASQQSRGHPLVRTAGCAELFDIQLLAGLRWPSVVGFQDTTLDGILVAPPAAWQSTAELAMPDVE